MKAKRTLYAWLDARSRGQAFRVSLFPPDAPVRPSLAVERKADVLDIAERKRAEVIWWPPLPMGV